MRYLFYMGHPAHFHLFKNIISMLKKKGKEVMIVIKKKDVLEDLVKATGWNYININPRGRRPNKLSIALALLYRDWQMIKICRQFKPDVMMATAVEITHAGKLLGIKSWFFNEDDVDVIPLAAKLAFPFADKIICPNCCPLGKWENKKTGYESYHELAYLHPDYFTPDAKFISEINPHEKYFILRFSELSAHHDTGIKGISNELAWKICELLKPHGKVYITSERKLDTEFEPYRISIRPENMHHALYFAQMFIGDSQTMSAEAGVLGTPFIRYNDFVGRIGYLEELENKYHLGYGIKTSSPEKIFERIKELLSIADMKKEWQVRRNLMLNDKIDFNKFILEMIEE